MHFLLSLLRLTVLSSMLWASSLSLVFAANCPANQQQCNDDCIPETDLCILEPFPGMPSSYPAVRAGGGNAAILGPFTAYLGAAWPFIVRTAIAIGILNCMIGGFKIITSGGDSGALEEGKTKLLWTAVGIIIFVLSGVILKFLNPTAFQVIN